MSLKDRIKEYYRKNYPSWVSGMHIEKLALNLNYKASNSGRRLRELCNEGVLERREVRGYVEYRFMVKSQRTLVWLPRRILAENTRPAAQRD